MKTYIVSYISNRGVVTLNHTINAKDRSELLEEIGEDITIILSIVCVP